MTKVGTMVPLANSILLTSRYDSNKQHSRFDSAKCTFLFSTILLKEFCYINTLCLVRETVSVYE